jgi:hypothetical protein
MKIMVYELLNMCVLFLLYAVCTHAWMNEKLQQFVRRQGRRAEQQKRAREETEDHRRERLKQVRM